MINIFKRLLLQLASTSVIVCLCAVGIFTATPAAYASHDLDGDGIADLFVWRPTTQKFYSYSTQSASVIHREDIGSDQDEVPLVGDINGNGLTDLALWDPTNGTWTLVYDDLSRETIEFGQAGDIPLLLDFDGDGKDELVVRRPETFEWFIRNNALGTTETVVFGRNAEDIPVVADYDGDGIDDLAVRRPSTHYWYIRNSSGIDPLTDKSDGISRVVFGKQSTDIPITGDFDGDGRADIAVRRPSNFTWYIKNSSGSNFNSSRNDGIQRIVFGRRSEYVPVPADYDGDGITDAAVRWNDKFTWYIRNSSGSDFNSSRNDGIQRIVFGKNQYDIPAIAPWFSKRTMLQEATVTEHVEPIPDDNSADGYYQENISTQIVQGRCVACHVEGGVADGLARLLFVSSNTANYQTLNQQAISEFLSLDDVNASYLLSKASGGQGHVGGAQLPFGGDDYELFRTYLELLTGEDTGSGNNSEEFWQDAVIQSSDLMLRRAGLLFGKYPEQSLLDAANTMSEQELKQALLDMMQGEGFHEFIVRSVNDKLLVEGVPWGMIDPNNGYYPALNHRLAAAREADSEEAWSDFWSFYDGMHEGYKHSPLELFAYIIENDRPYTEILTADYTMLNPYTNEAFRGDASGFVNSEDDTEFRPGKVHGIMIDDGTGEYSYDGGFSIIREATNVSLPHAGVLNNHAFLTRYPTTATNRNRARARWTYYHFLDFDIEKSVARTQDSDDLADIDNPTMNNPNCSACHQLLDPIAGAYKFYFERGEYLASGGADSLYNSYKIAPDSPYQFGDTWYRGMREPGFEGQDLPGNIEPMQWLAQEMVSDPRFAVSAIKFWWPALMGVAPLSIPENPNDSDYQAALAAYTEQKTYISQLAEEFRNHWNIKQVFAEIMMSPWYRLDSFTGNISDVQEQTSAGVGALLGPEKLDQKTRLVTGANWKGAYGIPQLTEGEFGYRLTYGGINSIDLTKRSEDMTSLMSQVALTHAAELSCPVVINDFIKPDSDRILFSGLSRFVDTNTVMETNFEVVANEQETPQAYEFEMSAGAGDHTITLYPTLDTNEAQHKLVISSVSVSDAQNNLLLQVSGDQYRHEYCHGSHPEGTPLQRRCGFSIPVTIEDAGDYKVSIQAINHHDETEAEDRVPILMQAYVRSEDSSEGQAYAEAIIRQKLVDLHFRFLGEKLSPDDEVISASYALFETLLNQAKSRNGSDFIYEYGTWCNGESRVEAEGVNSKGQYIDYEFAAFDPLHSLKAWRGVIAYMLSDHKFLHDY